MLGSDLDQILMAEGEQRLAQIHHPAEGDVCQLLHISLLGEDARRLALDCRMHHSAEGTRHSNRESHAPALSADSIVRRFLVLPPPLLTCTPGNQHWTRFGIGRPSYQQSRQLSHTTTSTIARKHSSRFSLTHRRLCRKMPQSRSEHAPMLIQRYRMKRVLHIYERQRRHQSAFNVTECERQTGPSLSDNSTSLNL